MDDDQIIGLYFARDEQAIQETDAKYGHYCGRLAERILKDRQDAEEVVNDTWMQTWRAIPPERPNVLRLYLARISRNIAFSRYRKETAQKRGGTQLSVVLDELAEAVGTNTDPGITVEQKELTAMIRGLLEELPVRDRNIFIRRYFFVDSTAEIAARFALKESNVLMILSRVRSKLKTRLIKEGYV